MKSILSYFFSLFVLLVIWLLSNSKIKIRGIDKNKYNVNIAWYCLFLFIASYMTTYIHYNVVLLFSVIIIYIIVYFRSSKNVPLNEMCLPVYFIFCLWCGFRLLESEFVLKGIMMMVKLVVPVFFFMFAYRAFTNKQRIWAFFDKISKLSILYLILSIVSIPINDYFEIYPYFGMTIFPFTFIMFLRTREKKYLFYSLLCLSHNVIDIKRTPLVAMTLMLGVYFYFKYKWKALIPVLVSATLLLIAVLYIPALNERMFFDYIDPKSIDWEFFFSEDAYEAVNTHGRNATWDMLLDRFYKGHEWTGCGLGTAKGWLQSPLNPIDAFALVHNDWLQFLCEVGIIGVSIFALFNILVIAKSYKSYNKTKSREMKDIALLLAMITIAIDCHMFFENCFGGFGFCVPFACMAIFYRFEQFEKKERALRNMEVLEIRK